MIRPPPRSTLSSSSAASDVYKRQVEVVVLKVDKANKKISLGYRQLLSNPWDELRARHPEGSIVEGVVKNVADFGVFGDVGGDIDGLGHVSDLALIHI